MLPGKLDFSQGNLQDYIDCQRRFQLRHVKRQPWPAIEIEPALEREEHSIQGRRFHRLMERYYLGVPEVVIEESAQDEPLRQWWQAFKDEPPMNLPSEKLFPEVRLSVPTAGQRLVAVFDLLAVDPGRRLVIVDWKTGRYRPERELMEKRLQTRVYPYVAVEAGARIFGEPVDPDRVSMVYWYPERPMEPHLFFYNSDQHEENRRYLTALIEEITAITSSGEDGVWPLTTDERHCGFCVYRSLCNRGIRAQSELPDEFDDPVEVDSLSFAFDFENIDEISY